SAMNLFFGLSTASYTCVLAWLAPFFIDLGWQATQAGLLLAFLTLMEVVAGLLLPTLAARSHDRRPLLLLLLLSTIGGFIGLALMPLALPWLWAALLGIGIGGLFPLSLIVTLDHLDDYSQAGQLTAFVQGIGYLLASLSPLLAGYLKDSSSSFTLSWLLLAAVSLGMLAIVWRFDPKRHSQHFALLAH
ncbi:MFS transporter, partial [Shewanella algae]|uniref:MFS transporter n=1 Tax=Shewanella algae TaxID=38313 RepID=UPI001F3B5CA0